MTHLEKHAEGAKRAIETGMGTRFDFPLRFITGVKDRALEGMSGSSAGPTNLLLIDQSGTKLSPTGREVFRLAVREGLLIPTDPPAAMGHAEQGAAEYRINPLILLENAKDTAGILDYHRQSHRMITLDLGEIKTMAERCQARPMGGHKRRMRGVLFVSHWFQENQIYIDLESRLAGHVAVKSGYNTKGQITADVQSRVESADRVLVDLNAQRAQCFVELGWAIGYKKPVMWVVKNLAILDGLPEWIRLNFEVYQYEKEGDRDLLVSTINGSLNSPASDRDCWKRTTQRSLLVNPDPGQVTILGGNNSGEAFTVLRDQCRSLGYQIPLHKNLASPSISQPLYEVIYERGSPHY